ncbi:MAG TPA: response regulator [Xenococcaceae cyanobacterium]
MSEDKELQVRLQFLEEAREYLNDIESGLLGLSSGQVATQDIDGVLRAAHSIKGGAAMMGFQQLSHLAHRLEDFFKVLKARKIEVSSQVESLFLAAVDFLRQIIHFNRQKVSIDSQWLQQTVNPVFEQLYHILGDPQPEDDAALLSAEVGEDMSTLIFETEVEELLQQLENSIENSATANLSQDLLLAAQELSGLGEMLELESFCELCQSVIQQVEQVPEQVETIAQAAIQEWRRSQALVLVGQTEVLPTAIELDNLDNSISESQFFGEASAGDSLIEELPDSRFLGSLLNTNNLEQEALELFSSLEAIAPELPVAAKPEAIADVPDFEIAPSVSEFGGENNTFVPIPTTYPVAATPNDANSVVEDQTIRVSVKQLEQLSDLFGEVAIERNGLGLRLKNLRSLVNLLGQRIKTLEQSNFQLRIAYDQVAVPTNNTVVRETAGVASDYTNQAVITSIASELRTQTAKYFDSLEMDSYGDIHLLSQEVMETVVQIKEVSQDIAINLEETEKNTRHLHRTTKQLQSTITRVRMRPISDSLNRFPRALRDMEMQHGKKVKLEVHGAATLIDRSILEALNDPLMHLFRNAFDHGIEPAHLRLANNKPEEGTITIRASHRGNQTIITIADDGGGIDLAKIKAKALSIGIDEADINRAKDEDLLELIFEPGFSTAREVTDLSGRGVGMDVVRTNIEAVKGTINVDTKLGIGTTFTIIVPLTLSVVRVLLVESGGMLLAFPTNVIEEMLLLDSEQILAATGQEVLNWEGMMIRLIRLNQWLNLPLANVNSLNDIEDTPTIEAPTVLVIAQNNELVGIQIDRYWQEEEVTIRSVEGNIPLPAGFSGCTILGDGRVVLLVDTSALLNWIDGDRQNPTENSLSSSQNQDKTLLPKVATKDIIMVVDDSINVRRFLALTLEKANYQVEQARDGQDAIDKINSGITPQAVICDIEMPRLDGFGFLSRIQSHTQHKEIPVIMLTSRSGDKHRRLAMNLGATAYFSKPFKETELLATLTEVITK